MWPPGGGGNGPAIDRGRFAREIEAKASATPQDQEPIAVTQEEKRPGKRGPRFNSQVQKRNKAVCRARASGDSIDAICERFGISAASARQIVSRGKKAAAKRQS